MSENIYDLANGLERAFRKLPEYKAVAAAKEKIDQDETAKQLLADYVTFQQGIQAQLQAGQMPGEEAQATMQEFTKKIQANPIVNEYFMKQQQLGVYVQDLENIIFKPIQDLM